MGKVKLLFLPVSVQLFAAVFSFVFPWGSTTSSLDAGNLIKIGVLVYISLLKQCFCGR